MIDKETFVGEWKALLVRFGRKVDEVHTEQGRRFYAFLSPQMDTDAFVRSARSVWATSRFFPRPADFLLCESAVLWGDLTALLRTYNPPGWSAGVTASEWWDRWRALPAPVRDAADALGDPELLQRLANSQPLKLRDQWERGFEQFATSEAVGRLPAVSPLQGALAAGTQE